MRGTPRIRCGTSFGMKMCASSPAAAAYAARALAAFPADGAASFFSRNSTHMETAHDMPRALNDPVGFSPSSLIHRSAAPMRLPGSASRQKRCHSLSQADDRFAGGNRKRRGRNATSNSVRMKGPRDARIARIRSRSYRTSSGPPQVHRLCGLPDSYSRPQRLHSRLVTCVAVVAAVNWSSR